jgi:hypothetical protein
MTNLIRNNFTNLNKSLHKAVLQQNTPTEACEWNSPWERDSTSFATRSLSELGVTARGSYLGSQLRFQLINFFNVFMGFRVSIFKVTKLTILETTISLWGLGFLCWLNNKKTCESRKKLLGRRSVRLSMCGLCYDWRRKRRQR